MCDLKIERTPVGTFLTYGTVVAEIDTDWETYIKVVSILNKKKGNGHYLSLISHLEKFCKAKEFELSFDKIENLRFAKHLIKRGYTVSAKFDT